jgi:ribosomal protein S16
MHPNSLANLSLGRVPRQRKVKVLISVEPDTLDWLQKGGGVSARVEELVARAKAGQLLKR